MASRIRIVLVDDHPIVREGLRALLESEPGLEIVGEAEDGERAVSLALELAPDLVLMDLLMPGVNGIEATRRLVERDPAARVLVLTSAPEEQAVREAIAAGAAGYLFKDVGKKALIDAIRAVAGGRRALHPEAARVLKEGLKNARGAPLEELTPRERSLVALLADGRSNRQIANRLGLTEGTVKGYLTTLFDKLGVDDRTQAVLFALKHGLAHRGLRESWPGTPKAKRTS